jgi:hypothetical protein
LEQGPGANARRLILYEQNSTKAVEPLGRAQWEIRITAFCLKKASDGCKAIDSTLDSLSKPDDSGPKAERSATEFAPSYSLLF